MFALQIHAKCETTFEKTKIIYVGQSKLSLDHSKSNLCVKVQIVHAIITFALIISFDTKCVPSGLIIIECQRESQKVEMGRNNWKSSTTNVRS